MYHCTPSFSKPQNVLQMSYTTSVFARREIDALTLLMMTRRCMPISVTVVQSKISHKMVLRNKKM